MGFRIGHGDRMVLIRTMKERRTKQGLMKRIEEVLRETRSSVRIRKEERENL